MSSWSLQGRRALVTGASRGIGRAIAEELLGLGAKVIAVARGHEDLAKSAECWHAEGYSVQLISADLATPEGRAEVISEAKGSLHILVNNAGMNLRRDAVDYREEEVRQVLEINQIAAFELTRALQPALARAEDARVVNVASVSGLTSTRTGTPYAMSKAALIQMSRNLAVEWAPDGIRVNAVAPWYIRTELVAALLEDEHYRERVLDRTPLGTLGEPADVAAAVAFLCLPASRWITGQCLAVDGGFGAHGFAPH
jgi:tropinone reductase I